MVRTRPFTVALVTSGATSTLFVTSRSENDTTRFPASSSRNPPESGGAYVRVTVAPSRTGSSRVTLSWRSPGTLASILTRSIPMGGINVNHEWSIVPKGSIRWSKRRYT